MTPQKSLTPHVPISPKEIIEQTHEAYEIGITIAHLHAREENGTPTYKISVSVRRHNVLGNFFDINPGIFLSSHIIIASGIAIVTEAIIRVNVSIVKTRL